MIATGGRPVALGGGTILLVIVLALFMPLISVIQQMSGGPA